MSIFFPSLCCKGNEAEREDVGQTAMKWRPGPLTNVSLWMCVQCGVYVSKWTNIFLCPLVDMCMQKDMINISLCICVFICTAQQGGKKLLKLDSILSPPSGPPQSRCALSYVRWHTHIHTSMFTRPVSTVPPWFPQHQLCLPHCKGGMFLQRERKKPDAEQQEMVVTGDNDACTFTLSPLT